MLEEGAFSAPGGEVLDCLHLVHAFARVAQLGLAREIVASRFAGPFDAQGELSGLGRPLVCAGEVADEGFSEINPAVDAEGLQAVKPRPGCALKHERDVLHNNALVAVCYADVRGVVDQPVLRLHRAGVLGRISWEREPSRERLISDSRAEIGQAQCIFFF